MNNQEIEEKKLSSIISSYDEYLEDLNLKLKNVFNFHKNYEEALEEKFNLENKIKLVEKNINKPYFARIDFQNTKDNVLDSCYIGKVGISDFDNKIITVDWRAPISTLYYDSNIGHTSYEVNDETIDGDLLLKRQYNIENKKLLSFNDVDTVSNDELLKPYLGVNSDIRLKNIVSTIQAEQNSIIRSSIADNLIIQGVAGSGKTTVALHRIAYLVYNYRKMYKDSQYMVIGPNKFFINYISSVLPDLDVNNVNQYDLKEFAEIYIGKKVDIYDGNTKMSKYKSSLEFKSFIDDYVNNNYIFNEYIDGFKIDGIEIITKSYINKVWNELNQRNYECYNKKIDRMIVLMEKYLEVNAQTISLLINDYFDSKNNELNNDEIRKLRTKFLENYNKNKLSLLKKYLKNKKDDILKVYKKILKEINNDDLNLYFEDIPGLLYLNYKINGSSDYDSIKHVVIDEAQDYNEFTFFALKKIISNSTFSIYGDLAQSLYPCRSLDNWESIQSNVFAGDLKIKYLKKSYRTTIEIMDEANKINRNLNLCEAIPVIRHGDTVEYIKSNNINDEMEKCIRKLESKKLRSIAIITKNNEDSIIIFKQLSDKFNVHLIDNDNLNFEEGIFIITSALSKGLEFDGVIIYNASDKNYNSNNNLDNKLLYVSMTRAIHNLIIIYRNEINKFLV